MWWMAGVFIGLVVLLGIFTDPPQSTTTATSGTSTSSVINNSSEIRTNNDPKGPVTKPQVSSDKPLSSTPKSSAATTTPAQGESISTDGVYSFFAVVLFVGILWYMLRGGKGIYFKEPWRVF